MDITKEHYKSDFMEDDSLSFHIQIENELSDYIAIAKGEVDYVSQHCSGAAFLDQKGKGRLSDNDLQNIRYHFVVSTAMITRYCVMNGMELEKAYNLSDHYIQRMDKCTSMNEIGVLHTTMCHDFCNKMYILKKSTILSKPVVLCMDYIYSHIQSRITIKQLAEHTNLSESYLSKIFRKEMGIPISDYIILQKIKKAKNMLSYSEYSLADIAYYLGFSSQSHFIQVFQKQVGITPHKYRREHFRNHWDDLDPEKTTD